MGRKIFVFLNGYYHKNDFALVKKLIRQTKPRPQLMAVDGGLSFLQKLNKRPDYWLSDLDSTPRIRKGFLEDVELIFFPEAKDQTDGDLALDVCADLGYRDLTFFGWYDRRFESDHLLGNLLLCTNLRGRRKDMKLSFLDSAQEIYHLRDGSMLIKRRKDCRLSIIPLGRLVVTIDGAEFKARNLKVSGGQTVTLRNRIISSKARINVKGSALILVASRG